ncbi:regulatory protein RecX [Microbulbifer sp. SA54]|uniref:regulatory protein RecX n=1 Tax=Microbulbifer sp. SA54 TaxID=3401577 RepID=UPI003AB0D61E
MSFLTDTPGGQEAAPPGDSPADLPDSQVTDRSQTSQALFTAAIDLLSRREHSCHELRQKLVSKFPDADFESVLERLQALNYQSDQRFAEVFARSRVQRGQGPLRIRQELQLRGIGNSLVQESMEQLAQEVDWFELAADQLLRKFRRPVSDALPRDQQQKERARRQRYLAYRGFSGDAVRYAIEELDRQSEDAKTR